MTTREACCGEGLPEHSEGYAGANAANVKRSGQNQKGVALSAEAPRDAASVRYIYHDPCHSPMKTYRPLSVASQLMGTEVPLNERCCGEAGTFAVTRPDISTQVRFRKEEELRKGVAALRADGFDGEVKILTACPSCQQGLSRYNGNSGTTVDYIVVEMARHLLGENWMADYVNEASNGGIERVLL
jgi:Fe-S oxidoreductase